MPEHPHAALARAAWQAAAVGDAEALAHHLEEDVVWHASGRGPRSGDYSGRDAVFTYLAGIGDAADRFDSRLEHVLVGEDRVAVLFQVTGQRRGRTLDTGFILIFRIVGTRIGEVWAVPRDQYAVDEFWD